MTHACFYVHLHCNLLIICRREGIFKNKNVRTQFRMCRQGVTFLTLSLCYCPCLTNRPFRWTELPPVAAECSFEIVSYFIGLGSGPTEKTVCLHYFASNSKLRSNLEQSIGTWPVSPNTNCSGLWLKRVHAYHRLRQEQLCSPPCANISGVFVQSREALVTNVTSASVRTYEVTFHWTDFRGI